MASLALWTTNGDPAELAERDTVEDHADNVLLAGGDDHLAVGECAREPVGAGRRDGDRVAVDLYRARSRSPPRCWRRP